MRPLEVRSSTWEEICGSLPGSPGASGFPHAHWQRQCSWRGGTVRTQGSLQPRRIWRSSSERAECRKKRLS